MVTDCCAALRRVHLPGYHVVPLLLLRSGLGSRFNCHGGRGNVRVVHIPDCLVRHCVPDFLGLELRLTFILGNSVFVTRNSETFVM